jgi:hypothetical protein
MTINSDIVGATYRWYALFGDYQPNSNQTPVQNLSTLPNYIGQEIFINTSGYTFIGLPNNTIYSGISTNTLTVSSLATTSYNGIYRCRISYGSGQYIDVNVGTRYITAAV